MAMAVQQDVSPSPLLSAKKGKGWLGKKRGKEGRGKSPKFQDKQFLNSDSTDTLASSNELVLKRGEGGYNPLAWDNMPDSLKKQFPHWQTTSPLAVENATEDDKDKEESKVCSFHISTGHMTQLQSCRGIPYVVMDNDTLNSISLKFDTTPAELARLNKRTLASYSIFPGDVVYIPDGVDNSCTLDSKEEETCPTCLEQNGPDQDPEVSFPPLALLKTNKKKQAMAKSEEMLNKLEVEELPTSRQRALSSGAKLDVQKDTSSHVSMPSKYISDDQGCVHGTLIISTSSVLFKPSRLDPLVQEQGASQYEILIPLADIANACITRDVSPPVRPLLSSSHQTNDSRRHQFTSPPKTNTTPVPTQNGEAHTTPVSSTPQNDKTNAIPVPDNPKKDKANAIPVPDKPKKDAIPVPDKPKKDKANAIPFPDKPKKDRINAIPVPDKPKKDKINAIPVPDKPKKDKTNAIPVPNKPKKNPIPVPDKPKRNKINPIPVPDKPKKNKTDTIPVSMKPQNDKTDIIPGSNKPKSDQTATIPVSTRPQIGKTNTIPVKRSKGYVAVTLAKSKSETDLLSERDTERGSLLNSSDRETGSLEFTGEEGDTPVIKFLVGNGGKELSSLSSPQTGGGQTGKSGLTIVVTGSADSGDDDVHLKEERDFVGVVQESTQKLDSRTGNGDQSNDLSVVGATGSSMDDLLAIMGSGSECLLPKSSSSDSLSVISLDALLSDAAYFLHLKVSGKSGQRYTYVPVISEKGINIPSAAAKKDMSAMVQCIKTQFCFVVQENKLEKLVSILSQHHPQNSANCGSPGNHRLWVNGFFEVIHDLTTETEDAHLSVCDDHFKNESWEIYSLKDLHQFRNIVCTEIEEHIPLPAMSDESALLSSQHLRKLLIHLPFQAVGHDMSLVYSTFKHGISLRTMYRNMLAFGDTPILFVVRDEYNKIFGAVSSSYLKLSDHFYGTGESFLFSFGEKEKLDVFSWTGLNSYFIKGNTESITIGSGDGHFGLWLDENFLHGSSCNCETYGNPPLASSEDFLCTGVEAWGFP